MTTYKDKNKERELATLLDTKIAVRINENCFPKNEKNEWVLNCYNPNFAINWTTKAIKISQQGKSLFLFDSGRWVEISREFLPERVEDVVRRRCDEFFHEYFEDEYFDSTTLKIKGVKDITGKLRSKLYEMPNLMAVRRSMTDGAFKIITVSKVYKLSPRGELLDTESNEGQYYNFCCLPDFEINESIELPEEIQAYFNTITQGDQSMLNYIQEMIGTCLLNQKAPQPYIYIIHGGGKNGKSTFIDLIARVVGMDNLASLEFDKIDPQTAGIFENKYVNCPSEISSEAIKSDDLKKISSNSDGDFLTINEKYKEPRQIIPFAKNIACCNELPKVYDKSEGMWRRIQVVPFDFEIQKSEEISSIEFSKIFEDNADILRAWAFNGLIRIIKNKGYHSDCDRVRIKTKNYRGSETSIQTFFKDLVKVFEDGEFVNRVFGDPTVKEVTLFDKTFDKNLFARTERGALKKAIKLYSFNYKIKTSDLYTIYEAWTIAIDSDKLEKQDFYKKVKRTYIDNVNTESEYKHYPACLFSIDFKQPLQQEKDLVEPLNPIFNAEDF